MVDYNATEHALELGDDDALSVGDYEIEYDSTSDTFAVNHPNGEESTVPKNRSGSLVPQGLAESVSLGEALADDGNRYSSVQTAVDSASGWVFVGPGTFNESVTINTAGLTLEGCGRDTLIDGGTIGEAITMVGDNVTVQKLRVTSDIGTGNDGIRVTGDGCVVKQVIANNIGDAGISVFSSDCIVTNCRSSNVGQHNISLFNSGNRNIVTNNVLKDAGVYSMILDINDGGGNNSIIAGNICTDSSNDGIMINGNDNTAIGNRVINSGDDGIGINGIDNIVANNRISDSTNSDITDGGTGTVLDDNLTGPSN